MYKLFPLPISNSCSILKSSLEGKLYSEEVGTDFRRHHDKTHTGLGLKTALLHSVNMQTNSTGCTRQFFYVQLEVLGVIHMMPQFIKCLEFCCM